MASVSDDDDEDAQFFDARSGDAAGIFVSNRGVEAPARSAVSSVAAAPAVVDAPVAPITVAAVTPVAASPAPQPQPPPSTAAIAVETGVSVAAGRATSASSSGAGAEGGVPSERRRSTTQSSFVEALVSRLETKENVAEDSPELQAAPSDLGLRSASNSASERPSAALGAVRRPRRSLSGATPTPLSSDTGAVGVRNADTGELVDLEHAASEDFYQRYTTFSNTLPAERRGGGGGGGGSGGGGGTAFSTAVDAPRPISAGHGAGGVAAGGAGGAGVAVLSPISTSTASSASQQGSKSRGGFLSRMRHGREPDERPDGFIKVTTHWKDRKELSQLALCQRIDSHKQNNEAIWVMKFSPEGQYLASAGGSKTVGVIRVWRVRDSTATANPAAPGAGSGGFAGVASNGGASADGAASPPGSLHTPMSARHGESFVGADGSDLSVLEPVPYREYRGHESHVVDLAWSRTLLLLSASVDMYVRLWHVSRAECLHKFQHPDVVTSVAFHPTVDHYFLTGCFDKKLRVWNLETGRVALWQATTAIITAVTFSPDARLVVAGLFNGICTFYWTDGLRYLTQVECRNRRGRMKKGRKVTGLVFTDGGTDLLVSTNDSRCRLVHLDDYSMVFKYKGLVNKNVHIHGSFDPSGEFVISGSEDGNVYVWRTNNENSKSHILHLNKHKINSYESFCAVESGREGVFVPVALFAPVSTLALSRPPADREETCDPSAHLLIVTADSTGVIRVFENNARKPLALHK